MFLRLLYSDDHEMCLNLTLEFMFAGCHVFRIHGAYPLDAYLLWTTQQESSLGQEVLSVGPQGVASCLSVAWASLPLQMGPFLEW